MKTADILTHATLRGFLTEEAYHNAVFNVLFQAGETPIPARYDKAGNCEICGEAGRCPGWHTPDDLEELL